MSKRTPKTQKAYEKYLENIKEKGITPFSENEVIGIFEHEEKTVARVVKNKWPYDNLGYDSDSHLLLVILSKDSKVVRKLINHVKKAVKNKYEVFENSKKDRSVHEFRHLHLIDKSVNKENI